MILPPASLDGPGPDTRVQVGHAVVPGALQATLAPRSGVVQFRKGTMALRRAPTAADVMRILDAAYDVGQPRDQWMSGVLRAAGPNLDWGAGIGGMLYDISDGDHVHVDFIRGL